MDNSSSIQNTAANFLASGSPARTPHRDGQEQYQPLRGRTLGEEQNFYDKYPWCLQVFPTVHDVVEHLREELMKVPVIDEGWQAKEIQINVFLLCCAICEVVADYLLGACYDFSQVAMVLPFANPILKALAKLLKASRRRSNRSLQRLWRWRQDWDNALQEFLQASLLRGCSSKVQLHHTCDRLANMLSPPFPLTLQKRRIRLPAALHSQDLTHHDILSLADKLIDGLPKREQAILIVGLRTAGSYFAPILRSYLTLRGYRYVEAVTIRPKSGISSYELAELQKGSKAGALAVLVDEPPSSGSTLVQALECLRSAGFPDKNIVILVPVHPARQEWRSRGVFQCLSHIQTVTLEPEEYYKNKILFSDTVEQRLSECFRALGYSSVKLVESATALEFNRRLDSLSEEKSQNRLKRVYEVRLQKSFGETETRWVLVKSVGWGWLSYHAFVAGERLATFVPAVLGLRDGLLYTEWLCSPESPPKADRTRLTNAAASYVAARARRLTLSEDPTPDLAAEKRNLGLEKLTDLLTQVYGSKIAGNLKRSRVQYELSREAAPRPTFIDGRMRWLEWISSGDSFYKTDFEQHGLGKFELSSTDPAHDLAEFILSLQLTTSEEKELIEQYVKESDDVSVEGRLFLKKLQAGSWILSQAFENLSNPRLVLRHEEFHQRYMEALNFLVIHTMRHTASLCWSAPKPTWHEPLVVLDIDGVLDKQSFGFPSTSAAGIQAVSLLHAHDWAVAINTARSVEEVREYCRGYGFAGGIAEYGSWIWDRIHDRTRVLVSAESMHELELLRRRLRAIPGVFLNDAYQYSLKAFVYARGTTVPLPEGVIQDLMASLKLDRLRLFQTFTDSTVTAKETDKGRGLLELLALAGSRDMETIAVGDSDSDLAMFAVASRCFAPSHISCKQAARFLRCRIASQPYQRGLLSIVQLLVHPGAQPCARCEGHSRSDWSGFFWKLLESADQTPKKLLVEAMLDPMSIKTFVR